MSVMGWPIVMVCIVTMAASAGLTLLMRRLAFAHGILDVPNERSSHTAVTPRGGGLAIVITTTLAMVWLNVCGLLPLDLLAALSGGVLVALVGFLDDRFGLPSGVRFLVHVVAAGWAVFWLGGLPALQVTTRLVHLGWVGNVLAVVGVVWTLNLFNFMDGIDGIAASEAVLIAVGGSLLGMLGAGVDGVFGGGLVFAAACCGFLLWNWPPARIFMGDVGSGYVGYVIAVLALTATRTSPHALWVWLVLGGAFFVDATVTVMRRLLRGERVYQAHRSHAYQWLARKWGSHLRVTLAVWVLNLAWLAPCAVLATFQPHQAVWIAIGALTPLVLLALALGSGRPEVRLS